MFRYLERFQHTKKRKQTAALLNGSNKGNAEYITIVGQCLKIMKESVYWCLLQRAAMDQRDQKQRIIPISKRIQKETGLYSEAGFVVSEVT